MSFTDNVGELIAKHISSLNSNIYGNIEGIEKIEEIKEDYLKNIFKEFKKLDIKHFLKTFNYFENNIIFNIISLLGLKKSSNFALTNKRHNKLFRNIIVKDFIDINITKSYLINQCPHIKFKLIQHNHMRNRDIKKLDNIQELIIHDFINKTFPKINVQMLSLQSTSLIKLPVYNNIMNLRLLDCKIKDYSPLGKTNLKYLQLKSCAITTTYGLENIPTIELIMCNYIYDTSNLLNVENLFLIYCSRIIKYPIFDNITKVGIVNSNIPPINISHRVFTLLEKNYKIYFKNLLEYEITSIINIFKNWYRHGCYFEGNI